MNALEAARDHYVSRFEPFAKSLGEREPGWLRGLRRAAIESFAGAGFPSTKREEWRYTNVTPIAKLPFELPPARTTASRDSIDAVSFPVFACSAFVFVDGRYCAELSAPPALSGGLRAESLAGLRAQAPERLEPHLGQCADTKAHPFAALNTAFLDDGAVIFVPEGTRDERPLHVIFASTAEAQSVCHPRVLIVAEANSQATVIQDYVSLGASSGFSNAVTEIRLQQGAGLELVTLQRENASTFHVSNVQAHLERDSRFASHTLTLGGDLTRNDLAAVLGNDGAYCALHGLFVGSGRQLIDTHTLVDHAMPHGTSHELYKGILGGRSKGVFRGRVIVRPDAQRTDASQSNPNLLLADGAEINTKPQLEIHADDVKCSHGSSIGQIDPDALFYARCRGIEETAARDLLTRGFAAQILEALPVPGLAEGLDAPLLERLREASRQAPAR